jgi:hypothetical protein
MIYGESINLPYTQDVGGSDPSSPIQRETLEPHARTPDPEVLRAGCDHLFCLRERVGAEAVASAPGTNRAAAWGELIWSWPTPRRTRRH